MSTQLRQLSPDDMGQSNGTGCQATFADAVVVISGAVVSLSAAEVACCRAEDLSPEVVSEFGDAVVGSNPKLEQVSRRLCSHSPVTLAARCSRMSHPRAESRTQDLWVPHSL